MASFAAQIVMKHLGAVLVTLAAAASVAGAAASWPGRPMSPPPHRAHGPPAAWSETMQHSFWLAFGSYCWTSDGSALCVDMFPPQSRHDLPTVRVGRGRLIRIHLRFVPRDAHLTVFSGSGFKHYRLRPARIVSWKASRGGVASLDAHTEGGSASYLMRVVVRS